MKILVDGIEIDVTPGTEKTWADVLSGLEAEFAKEGATIVEVCIDGNKITSDDFDDLFAKEADFAATVALKTVSIQDILNLFGQLVTTYDLLCKKLENIPVEFQRGKNDQIRITVTELADSLELFFGAVPYMALFPERFVSLSINGASVDLFVKDLMPVLQDFLGAFENTDFVLVGDIAEYEIVPRLSSLALALKQV